MTQSEALSLQHVIHRVEAESEDEPLSRLEAASALVRELEQIGDAVLGYFVDQARHAGHSWSEIGVALGVSKQAAQQKQTVRMSLGLNAPTLERFTPRARRVLEEAEPIARHWGHGSVGTEHLLLALYREPGGVAAQVLVESGHPLEEMARVVGARIEPGPGAPDGKLSFTPKATAVFTGALAAALEFGHGYIGTEHLLLGLTRGDGLASEVLASLGLTEEALSRSVIEKLAAFRESGGAPLPPGPHRGSPGVRTRRRRRAKGAGR